MKIRRIEVTVFLLLAVLAAYSAGVSLKRASVASKVIRLRIVAEADDFFSQSKKLIVRDAVLDCCDFLLSTAEDAEQAKGILAENMDMIAQSVCEVVGREKVFIRLAECQYPTRTYRKFSLPAGRYIGLQIHLGEAAGKNWWCVLYPSFCNESYQTVEEMCDQTTFSFKSAEWISALCERLWS